MASYSAKDLEAQASKQLEESEALCDELARQIKVLNDQLAENEVLIQWLRDRVGRLEDELLRQLEY